MQKINIRCMLSVMGIFIGVCTAVPSFADLTVNNISNTLINAYVDDSMFASIAPNHSAKEVIPNNSGYHFFDYSTNKNALLHCFKPFVSTKNYFVTVYNSGKHLKCRMSP